ncbi:cytochrome c [Candidatus Pelagibacter ubique]|jgi:cytochrome c553|nr:cytochrome c [Candidatus Pelagibacter bacterium]MDA7445440.1 cytochrome c [Candidatus Pelagibacter ubique]MDA9209079.1 cytochrome c [bacterium]MDA7450729.1 cytochrome c [Candidatus Pelagibacter ubique]MDA7453395.1 cytochrome c [Candidatus Pelagibacter ubique]MDA7465934.1 cytochrome c [Candidatus Pelagibacter ubique]|tara:strand:- start:670 stop:1086 length:417 start_codon:yes stop_codon:yes gene_type:complete
MKIIFIVYFFFLLSIKVVIADTSQAGSGSVGATISKNLTAELRLGKEKVETICSACHGLDGVSASGGNSVIIPNLTAQHKDYLIAKLKDYKSKKLDHPQMTIIAQMLTDEEIAAVSEWYSRIKITVFDPQLILSKPSK